MPALPAVPALPALPAVPAGGRLGPAVVVEPGLARELRRRVLRPMAAPDAVLPGDDVAGAVHFAVLDPAGRPLSTCFIFRDAYPAPLPAELAEVAELADEQPDGPAGTQPARPPTWHLRQMATEPAARFRGAGAAVMRAVFAHVAEAGGGLLWCNARETAVGFYRAQGLRSAGVIPPQGDPPVAHQRMWCLIRV